MINNKENSDFATLVLKAQEGSLSHEERLLLNDLMRFPEYQKIYFEMIKVNCALKQIESIGLHQLKATNINSTFDINMWEQLAEYENAAPEIEIPKEKPQRELIQKVVYPPREKRKLSTFNKVFLVMNAAAILFVVLFLRLAPTNQPLVVARILDSSRAEWTQTASPKSRLVLFDGTLEVTKGILKFAMYDGTQVSIKAPSTIELEQIDQLYLHHGLMQAIVPPVAAGFVVRTPTGSVVDYGTEFSVSVDKAGATSVEVIKGIIELRNSSNPLRFTAAQKLTAGQTGTIDLNSNISYRDVALPDNNTEVRVRWECPAETGLWTQPSYWTNRLVRGASLVSEFRAEVSPKTAVVDSNASGSNKIYARRADVGLLSKYPFTVQMKGGQVQLEQLWIGRVGEAEAAEGRWIMSDGELVLKGRDQVVLFIGDTGKGLMEIDGGTVELFGSAHVGCNEGLLTSYYMNGDGTLVMNDGKMTIYGLLEVATADSVGAVHLNGGQIHAFDIRIGEKGVLLISGGTIILEGDKTAAVQSLIDTGLIQSSGSDINVEYDEQGVLGFEGDKTIVYSVD